MAEVTLSRRLYDRLRSEAARRRLTVEELVNELHSKALGEPLDPQDMVELHLKLAEELLAEAETLLAKEEYLQASEKAWGAAAHAVKALAAKEGRELLCHSDLWRYVSDLATKLGDVELRRLWRTANVLHQNFYEGWMPPEDVEAAVEDVKLSVEKLKKLL